MNIADRQPIPYQLTEAGLAALAPAQALPAEVRALLEAVHEALSVPLAALPEDDRTRLRLLDLRTCDARAVLSVVLNHGEAAHLPALAEHLRERTAEQPVTYTAWQGREATR